MFFIIHASLNTMLSLYRRSAILTIFLASFFCLFSPDTWFFSFKSHTTHLHRGLLTIFRMEWQACNWPVITDFLSLFAVLRYKCCVSFSYPCCCFCFLHSQSEIAVYSCACLGDFFSQNPKAQFRQNFPRLLFSSAPFPHFHLYYLSPLKMVVSRWNR